MIGLQKETSAYDAAEHEEGQAAPTHNALWTQYRELLDQIALEARAATAYDSDRALQIALKMGGSGVFSEALELLDELVPPRRETVESRKIRELLAMPIFDAGAAILEAALPVLNRRWHDEIYLPYAIEGRDPIALYTPVSGPLARFIRDDLGPFFDRGEPKRVIGDLTLPMGEGFLRWLDDARSVQGSLFSIAGGVVEIPVRLEGVPSKILGYSDEVVTRKELRLECAEGIQTFEYREGTSSSTILWTPDCQEVSLRVWVASAGNPARELRPRKEWKGPLAFPLFFQEATRVAPDRYRHNLEYDGVSVQVEYRMRSGEQLLDIVLTPPPTGLEV